MGVLYRCLQCGGQGFAQGAEELRCEDCGLVYPVIEGIPVFLPRPVEALSGFMPGRDAIEADLGSISDKLQEERALLSSPKLARRADHILRAIDHDLPLVRSVYRPIEAYLERKKPEDDFLAWASVQTGLSLHDMFSYFYQDWYSTREFRRVAELFGGAIQRHCRERASVAVLGAGAAGLCHALARDFDESFAVDLSLPALLLAKRLVSGTPLRLHLKRSNWVKVDLSPPPQVKNPPRFVTANVTQLPFADASLSVVVTQCLFDIVDNPLFLAEEIQRVLRPDGLWINFSHPFDAPGDPVELSPRALDEVGEVVCPKGFQPAWLEAKRFAMLDHSQVNPSAARTEDEVHFFGFRKCETRRPGSVHTLRTRFDRRDPELWTAVPKGVAGRDLALVTRRALQADGIEVSTALQVGPYSMPIPEDYAALMFGLLSSANGERTLREVLEALRVDAPDLTDDDFLELVRCLTAERYLLELVG